MLITQTEGDHSHASGTRVGLALAGGGPVGLIYEMGALHALEEALDGIDFSDLHAYVGVSAGAVIASILANRITPVRMVRIVVCNDEPEHSLDPGIFLTPAFSEYYHRIFSIPKLLGQSLWQFARNPLDIGFLESFAHLSCAMPTGIFDNDPIHQFIRKVFSSPGRTNDFRELKNKLYIVVVDLDTGTATNFGSHGFDHIPISKAVQASTALPGLYPPVEIDGRHYADGALKKTMHASVALEAGCDLVFCVNPIVPFDANLAAQKGESKHKKLVEGGAPVVLDQTFRAMIYSRMKVGMAKYATQFEDADIVLFEPDRYDSRMFFTNVFSFSNRRWVCEHAYQTTRGDLLARRTELGPILARHGISMRMDVLEDESRHFDTSLYDEDLIEEQKEYQNRITNDLSNTLDQLQHWVHSAQHS